MSQSDRSGETGDDGTDGTAHGDATGATAQELAETGREYIPEPPRTVRWGVDSGAAAAVGAGAALVSGLRAFRRGDGQSGFTRLLVGGALAIVAIAQRRSTRGRERDRSGVEEADLVDTSPDVEDVAGGDDEEGREAQRATGDEASEVVDTAPDLEGVEPESETEVGQSGADVHEIDIEAGEHESGAEAEPEGSETDSEDSSGDDEGTADATRQPDTGVEETEESTGESGPSTNSDDYERLGEAAFDEQSGRVPAPQEAFNLELLSSGAEAFWGVHESDEAIVVVSVEFDPIEETEEFRYVASSEIDDDDREVRVPDTVLDHWDDVAGGGTAVTSGTGLVFLIHDELRDEGLLVVVPEQWSDELLGETEE